MHVRFSALQRPCVWLSALHVAVAVAARKPNAQATSTVALSVLLSGMCCSTRRELGALALGAAPQ